MNATGVVYIPGVCCEGYQCPHAHFWGVLYSACVGIQTLPVLFGRLPRAEMVEWANEDTPLFYAVIGITINILAFGHQSDDLLNHNIYMADTQEELARKVRELQKEVDRLNAQLKEKRFGLTWIDVPEAFEQESENKIPVLEEVPELAIHNNDGKPTHILIEGDNYHALTCLNYTHRGKIDVIYIDPPYNTGNDGFTYRDARFLEQFPDGTPIPSNHPLRHSAWLSFMEKRLKFSKELLSDTGVIFISIDDNEQARLKLLCDNIFDENNFIAKFDWRKKTGANDAKDIAIITESILLYAKNKKRTIEKEIWNHDSASRKNERYKYEDEYVETRGKFYYDTLDRGGLQYSDSMNYGIKTPDGGVIYPNGRSAFYNDGWIWKWSKEKVKWGLENGYLKFFKSKKSKGSSYTIKYKVYELVDNDGKTRKKTGRAFSNLILEPINQHGNTEIKQMFDGVAVFSNPKPIGLIRYILNTIHNKDITILDFFAGSGTTLHASIIMNSVDGGTRQCILCQQNESNICERITYLRNKKVINGYKNSNGYEVDGFGNSLKYYKTSFVGKNQPKAATDDDKLTLAKKAGCLLSLAENTLYEQETTDFYQIYSDEKGHWTCIYFQEDYSHFEEFRKKVVELEGDEKSVYVFCWTDGSEFAMEFEYERNVTVKSIPQPILDIYKSLNA